MSDEELVSASLKDQKYFGELVKRYEDKFGRFVRRKAALSKEDTEDLLQDIFIKIYLNLNAFDRNLKFSSWGYRIAHNETISWYRKKSIRPQINFEDYEEENFINNIKNDSLEDDFIEKFAKVELKEKVKLALDKLDEKYKNILILKYLEEKEYTEIGDILEIPIGTVSTLIYRAKKELKKYLTNI